MPEVSRFFGIKISIYYTDHNPPHFHAIYNESVAEIDIRTLEIIAGSLPKRVYALVLEWASEHREELLSNWNLAKEIKEPLKIEPLT